MPSEMTVHDLKRMREQKQRHALLDVRERSEFHRQQIPWATPLPRGLLELKVPALVPAREVPIAVICRDGRRSTAAAETLERMGYESMTRVSGGMEAWAAAGYPTWTGIGVPGKEYGERVSVVEAIPQMTPEELAERRARGERLVVMDSRTVEEYRRAHLPGAYAVPGGELPLAVVDLVSDPQTTVVVNCAGRTRSILGAQTLMRMGLPNPVCGFKNGTMAWEMAGFDLERGPGRSKPPTSERAREVAERFAARVAQEEGLRYLTVEGLRRLRDEGALHYLIDVRLPEEYVAGHIPGAVSMQGGQLALQSEDVVAVLDAPIVMVCDRMARATLGASLYTRMGYPEVYVLEGGTTAWQESGCQWEVGQPSVSVFGLEEARRSVDAVSVPALKTWLDLGEPVVPLDVRGCGDYALGHLPGSRWMARGHLEQRIGELALEPGTRVVAVCDTGERSTLAAAMLRALGYPRTGVLEGGLGAWREAGWPLEEGLQGAGATLAEAKLDVESVKRAGVLDRNRADMVEYLTWEEELGRKYEAGH